MKKETMEWILEMMKDCNLGDEKEDAIAIYHLFQKNPRYFTVMENKDEDFFKDIHVETSVDKMFDWYFEDELPHEILKHSKEISEYSCMVELSAGTVVFWYGLNG